MMETNILQMGESEKKAELLNMVGSKLGKEYLEYKMRTVSMNTEEVFGRAYEIDLYISLYENLLEMMGTFPVERLEYLNSIPDILGTMYHRWLEIEDSRQIELVEFLERQMNGQGVEA